MNTNCDFDDAMLVSAINLVSCDGEVGEALICLNGHTLNLSDMDDRHFIFHDVSSTVIERLVTLSGQLDDLLAIYSAEVV